MRREDMPQEDAELTAAAASETEVPGGEATPVAPAPEAAPVPMAVVTASVEPRKLGLLGRAMALPEPNRTQELERITQTGMAISLRSLTGKDLLVRYGEHILVVPPTPKPFIPGHAIHILWYHAADVEEES
jgi:hypothetical protein